MNPAPPTFTAARIARALGCTKRAVALALGSTPAIERPAAGGMVKTWPLSALPAHYAAQLAAAAPRHGCRDAAHLLDTFTAPWMPEIPWQELDTDQRQDAEQLCEALAPSFRREGDTTLSEAEFWRLACADYARVFGKTISEAHLSALFARAKQRAGANEDMGRAEFFLRGRLMRAGAPSAVERPPPGVELLQPLLDVIAQLGANPHRRRHAEVWDEACATYTEALTAHCDEKKSRQAVLAVLRERADWLLRTDATAADEALRVNFHRKLARWREGQKRSSALEDRRLRRRKSEPYPFTDAERISLSALACLYGSTDLAWREFLASDKARPETKVEFERDPHLGRVRTPQWVRAWLDPIREDEQRRLRGPRTAKLDGAFHDRDPMTLHSGDSDQSDDKTPDLYWWDDTPDGVWFGQGQFIPWMDERSSFIYGFTLLSDGAYNGFDLRNSWTEKARKWGLPRARIHVEMGIWKEAKIFKGASPRNNGWENTGTEETEQGLRRLGIRFRHATLPRGKLIERVFGEHAKFERVLPGYAGNNQMMDRFEDVYRKARLVKSGQEHPADLGFLHRSQLAGHLEELIARLNTTVKHGEYHKKWVGNRCVHLSPKEAYEEFFSAPLVFIPPAVEHLLRDNKILKTVGSNGVLLEYGKRKYRYRASAELAALKGREVVVWFNPQDPSVAMFTDPREDPEGLAPFAVPLAPKTSHNATPEEMAAAEKSIAAFESYSRGVHRTLAPAFKEEFQKKLFRYPVIDSTTAAVSQDMELQRGMVKGRQEADTRRDRRVSDAARRIGMTAGPSTLQRPEAKEAIDELREFLDADDTEGQGATHE